MRSEAELREASGYADRPRDFDDLIAHPRPRAAADHADRPRGLGGRGAVRPARTASGIYQLTHDYLVHSLRDWLTRKQRETRRGRAELRLAERAAIWDAKPENRHLPSLPEWVNIRTLSRRKDWTEPQRRMMRRAGRMHGLRAVGLVAVAVGLSIAGLRIWDRIDSASRAAQVGAMYRVKEFLNAETPRVPELLQSIESDRRWIDPELKRVVNDPLVTSKARLRASLALLPIDPTQVTDLAKYLPEARTDEVSVLRTALASYRADLSPKLWAELESAKPDATRILPIASALALYDPDDKRWPDHVGKVAQALVAASPDSVETWLGLLRPVRGHLTNPLGKIFRATGRPTSEHERATTCLVDYASEKPEMLADLLMDADQTAYEQLFKVIEKQDDKATPILQEELRKKAEYSWNDPSWIEPDAALVDAFKSAQGLLDRHFAFCQTLPLAEFSRWNDALQKSGYRPRRFRPFAAGQDVKVAAVWTRDGRKSQIESNRTSEVIHRQNENYHRNKFIPVDVAGYITRDTDGKLVDRYAAVWVEKAADDDDARMYVAVTADSEPGIQDEFDKQELIPRTLQVLRGPDGRLRMSSVWGRPTADGGAAEADRELFEGNLAAIATTRGDAVLLDVSIGEASRPLTVHERARIARDRRSEDPRN